MNKKPTSRSRPALPAQRFLGRRFRFGSWLILALAALPIFQTTGCYPDFVYALNYELQSLVNTTLLNAVNIIIQNFLGL